MTSFGCADVVPDHVVDLMSESSKITGLPLLLSNLLSAIRMIGSQMRDGAFSSNSVGTSNAFGDNQLDVDLKADAGR
jgi:hypothetical protein